MIDQIHIHPKVEKDIEQMESLDNAPAIAAMRARSIIRDLADGMKLSMAGRLSGSKDARINNLYKFNLGKGYRLVTIREKRTLFIMFIGDHDQCDRWLTSHSRKAPHKTPVPLNIYQVKHCHDETQDEFLQEDEDDIPETLENISQKDLHKVFCGLVSSS
ncbi:MAG: hypothetical protein KKE62_01250 [Proteobacteria bacterium]|nr:hypothetical protein [Pseudomonadota bacterium]MBU1386878.1 hypothetical protein [Pseudomonadota bacterium]MBU1541445.1 hypothetical protein [Pseudomonadota bacterium]MBU2429814.1 hypothetical protein [Pseudomonadota bacterium]MBU2480177.1 hypothetical protein [Pseudomonadota bacterium]